MFGEVESTVGADDQQSSLAALEVDDDYALIEHQMEKQRQLESLKKRKDRLTGEDFIARQINDSQTKNGKCFLLFTALCSFLLRPHLILFNPAGSSSVKETNAAATTGGDAPANGSD